MLESGIEQYMHYCFIYSILSLFYLVLHPIVPCLTLLGSCDVLLLGQAIKMSNPWEPQPKKTKWSSSHFAAFRFFQPETELHEFPAFPHRPINHMLATFCEVLKPPYMQIGRRSQVRKLWLFGGYQATLMTSHS